MLKEILHDVENDLMISAPYAQISEIRSRKEPQDNAIRLYKASPNNFAFQIRTFKNIGGRKSKPRNMVAHVEMTLAELKGLVEWAENYEARK